mmetsp:Transcript_25568/g.27457  ORF Transcript_25568/g.27457 Transcript_25568/m.27457 type:complete len:239 (+) Transcript_25568:239-955(+)
MTNSFKVLPTHRTKRRAATIAANKIKKIAYDDRRNAVDIEKKNNKKRETSSSSSSDSSLEDKENASPIIHPPSISSLSLFLLSSSPLKSTSTSTMSLQSKPKSSIGSGLLSAAEHYSTDHEGSTNGEQLLSTAVKCRIEHQRRRCARQVNSTGTMYLSYKTEIRMSMDSPLRSPIMAKALQFTPVSSFPTTPFSHYRYRPPIHPKSSSGNLHRRSTIARRSGFDGRMLGSDIKARRLM